ncbi:MAG TPA: ATPase, T2SS/T4P/T4SS family [Methylomirabilota bacterium]|jgi:type IV pilus assembly protein PilB|nr:ATPase, T2SS/T4P/T4SS family [Methylomirabilota bacterium]
MKPRPRKLGEILIELGLVDQKGLDRALAVQAREGGTLGKVVSSLGLADENAVSYALADWLRFECVDQPSTTPAAKRLLSLTFCQQRLVAPIDVSNGTLRLAMADPLDMPTIQQVEFKTNLRVVPVVSPESAIRQAIQRLEPTGDDAADSLVSFEGLGLDAELEAVADDEDGVNASQLEADGQLPQTVRLVTGVLANAVKVGASDIHFEPQERVFQVRWRIDGMLVEAVQIPKSMQDATISRLKIMSGMDIAERRKPQDGRSQLKTDGRRIDLRVSTLPTQFGEKVVLRILDSAKAQIKMDTLGILPDTLEQLQRLLTLPQGMILVTGPTGSGKTSTLYASLNWVKAPTKNIVTIEDPIEYRLPGINQVQINTKAGLTFASGLRSFLRQDPNVVLVGEIRDQETASIALEASQTGHLLFSTLHTNDAAASITRLLDMGMDPFVVASSVVGILAQRLVRRICASCAADAAPADDVVQRIGGLARLPTDARWRAGRGCEACGQSGFKGRLAIHELLVVTDEVRALISSRAPDHAIRDAARRSGMRTLMEDGIAKAAQGHTTLDDVLRVAPRDDRRAAAAPETPAAAPAPVAPPAPTVIAPAPSAASTALGPTKRVLVVEDSPTIVQVLKYYLELEGYEVLTAPNGREGLALATRERPDVMVSDVDMPELNGIEMVRALRQDPATAHIPVMLLSAQTTVESETAGLQVGADDYVPKPVEPRRLAARVKALLARRQDRGSSAAAPALVSAAGEDPS